MAVRPAVALSLLSRALKSRLLFGLLVAQLFAALAIHVVFQRIERGQAVAIASVIGSMLRDESTMSRSYLIAQAIEDLHATNSIHCASLYRISGSSSDKFYDSTFKDACLNQPLEAIRMAGLDGNEWTLRVSPVIDYSFYLLKWLSHVAVGSVLLLIYVLLIETFHRERRKTLQAEARRSFIENLTQQVRHDVASPITALRMIAERAPLDAGTKAFLMEALGRTEGIFNTLKAAPSRDLVRLISLIERIVAEKKVSRSDYIPVEVRLDDVYLWVPEVEFGRVVSNLIDNAIEAKASSLQVRTEVSADQVRLVFSDNGEEIPPVVRENLGRRGTSFGKEKGSGLGLFHAFEFMSSCGGRLSLGLTSTEKVVLSFPRETRGDTRVSNSVN